MMVQLHNVILFVADCFRYGIPPWRWRQAWRGIQEEYLAEGRKVIWRLKKQGRVREDDEW